MTSKIIPEHDKLEYRKRAIVRWYYSFNDQFLYKKVRDGVYLLSTQTKEHCDKFKSSDHLNCDQIRSDKLQNFELKLEEVTGVPTSNRIL